MTICWMVFTKGFAVRFFLCNLVCKGISLDDNHFNNNNYYYFFCANIFEDQAQCQ